MDLNCTKNGPQFFIKSKNGPQFLLKVKMDLNKMKNGPNCRKSNLQKGGIFRITFFENSIVPMIFQ